MREMRDATGSNRIKFLPVPRISVQLAIFIIEIRIFFLHILHYYTRLYHYVVNCFDNSVIDGCEINDLLSPRPVYISQSNFRFQSNVFVFHLTLK